MYVPGGLSAPGVQQDVLQRYNPISDTVTLLAPMPTTNAAHAVTALGGQIYVVGGAPDGLSGTTYYIYDIASDAWTMGAPLLVAVQFPAAASDGEVVHVLGGSVTDLDTVQIYDPATGTWTLGPR